MMSPRKTSVYGAIALVASIWWGIQASPAYADVLGDQRSFFVNENYDQIKRSTITATLRAASQHAYVYVDDAFWSVLGPAQQGYYKSALENLALEFESRIYPIETGAWGSERTPGIDGDPRVTILIENLVSGNGGYFDSIHNYRRTEASRSNEREMVVISAQSLGTLYDKIFLGHEFQHLISFNQKEVLRDTSEEVWLNELRSEYAATLLGYNMLSTSSNLGRRIPTFLSNPSDSITEWPNVSQDYASVAVFAEYLTGRFGSRILTETLQSPLMGIASLNAWLARNGYQERFEDVFLDWMVANVRNDSTARFGYTNDILRMIHISPLYQATVFPGTTDISEFGIKPWQPVWYQFNVSDTVSGNGDAVRLDATGISGQFVLAYAVIWDDGTLQFQKAQFNQGVATGFVFTDDRTETTAPQKRVRTVIVVATSAAKQKDFLATESALPLLLKASSISRRSALDALRTTQATVIGQSQVMTDGALIKRNNGEMEIYVIRGPYRRYLRPNIIALYGHLNSANAIPLDVAPFDRFVTSNYVRGVNDEKVYAVWPDGTKHWLHMSGEQFTQSGRDWNALFIINDAELASYTTGVEITR